MVSVVSSCLIGKTFHLQVFVPKKEKSDTHIHTHTHTHTHSNKGCKCGATFGSGASKTHWEGGAGCRDRIRMSNKDSKKHAGTAKTISRKAMQKKA